MWENKDFSNLISGLQSNPKHWCKFVTSFCIKRGTGANTAWKVSCSFVFCTDKCLLNSIICDLSDKKKKASLSHGSWLNKPLTLYMFWKLWLSRCFLWILEEKHVSHWTKLASVTFCAGFRESAQSMLVFSHSQGPEQSFWKSVLFPLVDWGWLRG